MLKYLRIVLYALTGFFLFIIIYITFFSNQYKWLQNVVDYTQPNFYTIEWEKNEKWDITIEQEAMGSWELLLDSEEGILWDKNTPYDSYYVSYEWWDTYERKTEWSEEIITIWDGEYLFDLNDSLKKYTIQSKDFRVEVVAQWTLYVKNWERRVGFYSFDGIFKVEFKDIYTDEYTSSFYVFPWMYAKGSKYRKQTWVDEEIAATNELFYINNLQLSTKKKKQDSDTNVIMYSFSFIYNSSYSYVTGWVSTSLKKIVWATTDFLDISVLHNRKEKEKFREKNSYFEQLKTFKKPLFWELEGYLSIFFNKSKKSVYYKNLILVDLANLVSDVDTTAQLQGVVDTESPEHIANIFKNLSILKEISIDDYETTKRFINDFYFFYHNIYTSDFSTKHHVNNLYLQINEIEAAQLSNEAFLSHLFRLYNDKEISESELNTWLVKYIFASSKVLDPGDEKSFYYYYYAYNKILKNHIENIWVKREWFEDILRIFQRTSFINEGYFKSDQVKKGMLYINAEIIENIISYLYTLYFEDQRDGDDLLILKNNDINIDDATILTLEKNIDYLFVYQKNAKVLDATNESEWALLQKYERFQKESDEYFEAIINNDGYMNAKTLNALKNIWRNTQDEYEKPSIENAKKYLNSFNQTDITKMEVNVINGSYYEIDELRVASEIMSFDLHPLEFNKITNIKKGTNNFTTLSEILRTNSDADFSLDDSTEISVELLYEYLNNLGNVEIYPDDIEVEKWSYYRVKNINVGWVKYSFLFFPKADNVVKDVMEWLWVIYKLDNVKPEEWTRNITEEQEKYKNFFIDLISKTIEIERELLENDNDSSKDSVAENIFKNDFLFWKNGDFIKIQDKLNLQFENVRSELEKNSSTTFLDKIAMLAPPDTQRTDRWEVYRADFTSEYIISEFNSYFEKIEVQFYFMKWEWDIRYDFTKEKLQVLWKINIEDFDEFYNNLWSDYKKMSEVHNLKQKILGETNIWQLRYSAVSRDAIVTYPHKWSDITITFQKGEVLRVKYKSDLFEGTELKNLQNVFALFL